MSKNKLELDDVLTTYKFYTRKGERLAIFRQEVTNQDGSKELVVKVIKCSRQDEFEKHKAKVAFLLGVMIEQGSFTVSPSVSVEYTRFEDVHPDVFHVFINEGNSAKYTFMKFCNENFYKVKRETVEAVKLTFVGGGKTRFIGYENLNK